jgi:hypothetical protein
VATNVFFFEPLNFNIPVVSPKIIRPLDEVTTIDVLLQVNLILIILKFNFILSEKKFFEKIKNFFFLFKIIFFLFKIIFFFLFKIIFFFLSNKIVINGIKKSFFINFLKKKNLNFDILPIVL